MMSKPALLHIHVQAHTSKYIHTSLAELRVSMEQLQIKVIQHQPTNWHQNDINKHLLEKYTIRLKFADA